MYLPTKIQRKKISVIMILSSTKTIDQAHCISVSHRRYSGPMPPPTGHGGARQAHG